MEIVIEEAPVGDHRANGVVESALKDAQGQRRALKNVLESRANELKAIPKQHRGW